MILLRSGCLASNLTARFLSRAAGASAAKQAGLDKFVGLELCRQRAHPNAGVDGASVLRGPLTLPRVAADIVAAALSPRPRRRKR